MKTERHIITGASLSNIEEMADELGHDVKPDWAPYLVAVAGTETSALDEASVQTKDFSGLLREVSRCEYVSDNMHMLVDEDGKLHELEELLDQAAERLDQAEEEWMDAKLQDRKVKRDLNVLDIEVRNIYGIDRFYPVNIPALEMAEMLYGRKTLNQEDLTKLHNLFGFEIRLTNAIAHNWLPFATSKLEVTT